MFTVFIYPLGWVTHQLTLILELKPAERQETVKMACMDTEFSPDLVHTLKI